MGMFSMFSPKKSVAGLASGTTNAVTSSSSPRQSTVALTPSSSELENRLRGALWGYFAGDAIAAPTHWYYGGKRQIVSEYGGEIKDYTKPNQHLSGSILNKSDLNGGGRSKGFGMSKFSDKTIIGDVINHGKQDLWSPNKSINYHATLQKGENTLEVSIARVLMRSIVANGGKFNADHFREAYVKFMTTPGSHNDTYASTCHRMFFANLIFRELPAKDCPDNDQHNVDTMDGLVLPTIVALTGIRNSRDDTTVEEAAAECAGVTRRSSVLERMSSMWAGVVVSAVRDKDSSAFEQSLDDFSQQSIRRLPNARVEDSSTMSACYLSSAVPGLIDMIAKYQPDSSSKSTAGQMAWKGVLANANVGGENVHRGSVLGAVLGARAGADQLPSNMINGLFPQAELAKEIDDFVQAVLPKE